LQKHIADKPVRDNTQILENKRKELTKFEKRLKNYTEMRADGEITRERFFEYKAEIEPKIEELKKVIAELEVVSEPVEEVDFGERIKMLEYAMEQLVDFENIQDIPESVVDAFVTVSLYPKIALTGTFALTQLLHIVVKSRAKEVQPQRLPLPLLFSKMVKPRKNIKIYQKANIRKLLQALWILIMQKSIFMLNLQNTVSTNTKTQM